jgi:uncharacterized membrane protein
MFDSLLDPYSGVSFVFRWLHVYFAIIWIGLLYYFNFVQGAFMAETDAGAKSQVLQKLAPRALWWFRYAALFTFLTGVVLLYLRSSIDVRNGASVKYSSYWINILTGSLLATIMFLNVWGIIWRKQKVLIANAINTAAGKPADPAVASAAAQATLASRTNVLFSVAMLFFMLSASHLNYPVDESSNLGAYWAVIFLIVGAIEANGIFGKTGPITSIKGVITGSFLLTLLIVVVNHILI